MWGARSSVSIPEIVGKNGQFENTITQIIAVHNMTHKSMYKQCK